MAKISGLALTTLSVDDSGGVARDIRNDIHDFDFSTDVNLHDVTGLDKSAMERLNLLADFSINMRGTFNAAANLSHDVFKDVVGGAARTVSLGFGGVTLANEVLFSQYRITRAANGSLSINAVGALQDGTVPTFA